jgi:hypothetical protein
MTIDQKNMQILSDMGDCFTAIGLNPLPDRPEGILCVASPFDYGDHRVLIVSIYHPEIELIVAEIQFGMIAKEKQLRVIQLLNEINCLLAGEHFLLNTENGLLVLRAALAVPGYFLDKGRLKDILHELMSKSYEYIPLIDDVHIYKKKPQSIMRRHLRQTERRMKEIENEEKETKAENAEEIPLNVH